MGIFAAVFSAVLSSAKDLVSKKLAYQIDGITSTFASFAFALPFYLIVLGVIFPFVEDRSIPLGFMGLVFLRALTDTMAEGMKMHAFAHGDISVIACFFSISPLFLLITAPLITGDQMPFWGIVATIIVVVGSLQLVYKPSSTGWGAQKKGILLALGASLFFSLNTCFDRLAVKKEETAANSSAKESQSPEAHLTDSDTPVVEVPIATRVAGALYRPVMAGFAMTAVSALFLLPLVALRPRRLGGLWSYRRGLGLRGFLETTFMISKLYAIQFLKPSDVVGIQRISLVFSILGGRLFFKEEDLGRRFAAGLLILAGVFWIGWLAEASSP